MRNVGDYLHPTSYGTCYILKLIVIGIHPRDRVNLRPIDCGIRGACLKLEASSASPQKYTS